jgi:TatD DNase family protein
MNDADASLKKGTSSRCLTSQHHLPLHVDIGANLLDGKYQGEYNGSKYHEADLDAVLQRAWAVGVEKIIITAGTLSESRQALELARTDERLFCTVGVHPTRCGEFEAFAEGPEAYMAELSSVRFPAGFKN